MAQFCPQDQTFGPDVGSEQCRGGFDFTLTFEDAMLGLAPNLVFLLLAPVRYLTLRKRRLKLLKDSHLGFLKGVANGFYIVSCIILLAFWSRSETHKTKVSVAASCFELFGAFALAIISRLEHTRALCPSHLLQLFLTVALLCNAVQLRTLFLMQYQNSIVVLASIHTFLIGLLLLLESLNKGPLIPAEQRASLGPEDTLGLFAQKFFWHLNSLFKIGYNKILTPTDLQTLSSDITSEELRREFRGAWLQISMSNPDGKWNIYVTIWTVLKKDIMIPVIPRLGYMATTLAQPFLIKAAIRFVQNQADESINNGYGLIVAFGFNYTLMAIFNGAYYQGLAVFSAKLRSCLVSLIYYRTLRINSKDADVGAGTVLMNVDVELVMLATNLLHEFWVLLVTCFIALYILWTQLGIAFVAPTILSVFMIATCFQLGKRVKRRQRIWTDSVEKRVVATAYAVANLKAIRMLGLTEVVHQYLNDLREEDVEKNLAVRRIRGWTLSIANCAFQLAVLVTYVTYVTISLASPGKFNIETLFSSLAALKLVTSPLIPALQYITLFANAMSSLERVQAYLNGESIEITGPPRNRYSDGSGAIRLGDMPQRTRGGSSTLAIQLVNASFGVEHGKPLIKNINLSLPRGSLNMVIGKVGSGKSLLLRSLIGEMKVEAGTNNLAMNTTAYCSQTPWLKNSSIRDNIVAESEMDEVWYHKVVWACGLLQDFEDLTNGDLTLVGSKGISLSGGQKNRIALARAIFARASLLIIDDVLSGLDKTTERFVFQRVFGPRGLLRRAKSTIVLATHAVHFAHHADHIAVLDQGTIMQQGRYSVIKSSEAFLHLDEDLDQVADREVGVNQHDTSPENDEDSTPSSPRLMPKQIQKSDSETEDDQRRSGDRKSLAYYLSSTGWRHVIMYVFLMVMTNAATATTTVWLKIWANGSTDRATTIRNMIIFIVVDIVNMLFMFAWLFHFCLVFMTKSSLTLHANQLKALMKASFAFIVGTDTGSITNRFSQDMVLVDSPLPSHWLNFSDWILGVLVSFIFLALATPPVAAIVPVVGGVSYVVQRIYLRTSRQVRLMDIEAKAPLCTHFLETLAGITTVRAFGWSTRFWERNNILLDKSQAPFYLLQAIQNWLKLVLELMVAAIVTTVVALAVALRAKVDPGFLGLALVNAMDLGFQITWLVISWAGLETSLSAIWRIRSFSMETPTEESETRSVLLSPNGWPEKGSVSFKQLTASYDAGGFPVINNIDLEIAPGEKIGICGRTGSGKSSLIASLFGLLNERSGHIEIDGLRTADVSLRELRASIMALPQEPFLLNNWTVRENLKMQSCSLSGQQNMDALLLQALEDVGLGQRLAELAEADSNILDLTVKEIDGSLSQGEKQLFCLARAILGSQRIVIMDEATSSVDAATELTMLRILQERFRDRTVISIAHRLGTLMDCDRVVVMEAGRIMEVGTPGELMQMDDGLFAALIKSQNS